MARLAEQTIADTSSVPLERLRLVMRELDALCQQMGSIVEPELPIPAVDHENELIVLAGDLLWQRAIFAEHFGLPNFSDPASNIMLFLYLSDRSPAPSAGECCKAAGVPRTTALRWLNVLENQDLVRATADPIDGRKTTVALTDVGRTLMLNCLTAIKDAPRGGVGYL